MMNAGRIGTVDALDGLIAVISDRMRDRNEGEIGISYIKLAKGLQYLSNEKGYELYLDFDTLGEGIYSEALDDFLFFGGCLGGPIKEFDRRIYIDLSSSKKIMDKGKADFGDSFREYIERMADEFERYFEKEAVSASQ